MRMFFKFIAMIIIAVLSLFLVASLYLYVRYTPEDLAEQVKKSINVSLPGAFVDVRSIDVRLWPKPECVLHDVRLRIEGYDQTFFSAASLEAGIDINALLSDQVVVDEVRIIRPSLYWSDDKRLQQFIQQFKSDEDDPRQSKGIDIRSVEIDKGTLELSHVEIGEGVRFDAIDLTFKDPGLLQASSTLSLRLRYLDRVWTLDTQDLYRDEQHLSVRKLRLNTEGLKALAQVEVKDFSRPKISSTVSIDTVDERLIHDLQRSSEKIARVLSPEEPTEAEQTQIALPDLDLNTTFALDRFAFEKIDLEGLKGQLLIEKGKLGLVAGCSRINGLRDPLAKISIKQDKDDISYEGSLSVAQSDPIEILEKVGVDDINKSSGVLDSFMLQAKFSGDTESLTIEDALVSLDKTKIALKAKAVNPKRPVLSFKMDVDGIDLDPYLQAFPSDDQKQEKRPSNAEADSRKMIKELLIGGDIEIGSLTLHAYHPKSISSHLTLKQGVLRLDPFKMSLLDGLFVGRYEADIGAEVPTFHLEHMIRGLDLQSLYRQRQLDQKVDGDVDLSLRVDFKGGTPEAILDSLNGHALLDGHDITIYGMDMDQMISAYQRAKYLQLADMALLFTAGPLGSLASIGTRAIVTAVDATIGDNTSIDRLHALWRLDEGVAQAMDVALKTKKHRIAMKGAVDLKERRFEKVGIAVLDGRGCAAISQELDGPLEKIQPDYAKVTSDLMLGSLDTVLEYGSSLVRDCPVYYKGSVK